MKHMTQVEMKGLIDRLCVHFLMPANYTVRVAGKGSIHSRHKLLIRIGTKPDGISEDRTHLCTVIHEFAHALDHHRGTYDRTRKHGEAFFACLLETMEVCRNWGHVFDYPWCSEYGVVYTQAKRCGLVTEPHKWHFK